MFCRNTGLLSEPW